MFSEYPSVVFSVYDNFEYSFGIISGIITVRVNQCQEDSYELSCSVLYEMYNLVVVCYTNPRTSVRMCILITHYH